MTTLQNPTSYVLEGFLRCGECGNQLEVRPLGETGTLTYQCSTCDKSQPDPSVTADELERWIIRQVTETVLTESNTAMMTQEMATAGAGLPEGAPAALRDPERFPDQVRASIEGSLERLRVDRVDLLILHNPLVPEPDRATLTLDEALGVIDYFDRLREEGLFDHVGFTALGDGPTVRAAIASGRFDMAQVYYNMLNPTAGFALGGKTGANWSDSDFTGLLDTCREHDVGVMNIRIFAAGVLATDERHGREIPITANAEMAAEEARARAVQAALGERTETRSQTAIRFGLTHPAVSTVVFGVAEMSHVHQALAAPGLRPLEEDALAALRRAWDSDAFRG